MHVAVDTKPCIRDATAADVPAIVAMAGHFVTMTAYSGVIPNRPDVLTTLAERLIAAADATILLALHDDAPVGMIALRLYEQPFAAEVMAGELVWWVEPHARAGTVGVRLLKRAEQWARDRGAVGLMMVAPAAADRVGDFYRACKYEPIETSYQRRF